MLWLLPLIPILLAPLPALLAGRSRGEVRHGEAGDKGLRRRLAALGLLATGGTAAVALAAALASHGGGAGFGIGSWTGSLRWSDAITLRLALPPSSAVMAVLVPLVAAAIVAFAALHEERRDLGRLVALLVAFVGAMELLVCAADLLTLLIGWELVGACSWALIAHQWWEEGKARMAYAAFVVTRAGDLGLFLAAGAAFAATGSFAYEGLAGMSGLPLQLLVGGLLLAAASKSAQLPFSPWLFAAMAGPASVSALLHSATMVAAGAFLLVRLHPVLDLAPWFAPAAVALGLATALAGGVVALLQPHAKKLLAGSTSAHYGLMFVAAGAGYPLVALLHLVLHALFKAPLFLLAGLAGSRTGGYRLADMELGRALPWAAGASAVCALALAGLPPLGGAWSKEKVIASAGHLAQEAAATGAWLPVMVIVAGGLSAAYAARFHLQAYGRGGAAGAAGEGDVEGHPSSPWHGRSAGTDATRRAMEAPRTGEMAPILALATATALASVLWLPGMGRWVAHALATARAAFAAELPHGKTWELVASVALVLAGLALGAFVARRRPRLGEDGAAAAAATWLGLPAFSRAVLERPILALARGAARFDDRVLDLPPRLVGWLGRRVAAPRLARFDDRVVDAIPRLAGRLGRLLAGALAGGDRRVVDRGVEATSAFTRWLADVGSRGVEWVADRIPEGTGRGTGRAGSLARRLQTGLSHHYYTLIVVGLALVLVLLFAVRPPWGS